MTTRIPRTLQSFDRSAAPPSAVPRHVAIEIETGNTRVDTMIAQFNQLADPLGNAPPPEQGAAGEVARWCNVALNGLGAVDQLLDSAVSVAMGGGPSMVHLPAASIGMSMHLGLPHPHAHPPSLNPPAPIPLPLPSFGMFLTPGCVSVLIEGMPALRAGDMGIGVTCGSFAPPFEALTGSSSVYTGGSRAARVGDLTMHCTTGAAAMIRSLLAMQQQIRRAGHVAEVVMGIAIAITAGAQAMALANEAEANGNTADAMESADAGSAEAAAMAATAAGQSLAAAMAAAQGILEVAALVMRALMGKDPALTPGVGAVMGPPSTVMIGGIPTPNVTAELLGTIFSAAQHLNAQRRRRPSHGRPDANGTHCNGAEPVDIISGANFNSYLDFVTAGGLRWERHYRSSRHLQYGALGWSMRHPLCHQLDVYEAWAEYTDPLGQIVKFPYFRNGQSRYSKFGYVLECLANQRYRVSFRDEVVTEYVADPHYYSTRLVQVSKDRAVWEVLYDAYERISGFVERVDRATTAKYVFHYDQHHCITAIECVDAQGKKQFVAEYEYSDAGCMTMAVDAHRSVEQYEYDANRLLIAYRDKREYQFQWKYDKRYRCVWTSGQDGLWSSEFEYHPERSKTIVKTGPHGVWTYEYDSLDNTLTKIIDPYGGKFHRIQDSEGRVIEEQDWAGNSWKMLYDNDDAHWGRVDPFGNVLPPQIQMPVTPDPIPRLLPETHAGYVYGKAVKAGTEAVWGMNRVWLDWLVEQVRAHAQKVFAWQPDGAGLRKLTATERKDWLGNVVEQVSVKGEIEQRRYDAAGNEIWRKDRDGREWCREIVSWDLIGAQVNALGHRVRYEYNTTEHVTKIVDGGGTTSEYRYDAKDRLVEVWRHGAKREEYVYNELDQFEEKRDGAGRIMLRIRPHENGLPRYIEPAVGKNLLYAYDEHGRATEATVGFVKVELARDMLSRRLYDLRKQRGVVHEHRTNGTWKSTLFGKYVMQANKRSDGVVEITSPSGKVERLYCDHWGAVHRSTSAGTQALLQYNEHGQLLARMIWRKGGSVWTTKYVRSPEGLIARIEDSIKGTTHYELDAAARLIAEVTPSGERHEYVHDAANNLIKIPGVRSIELRAGNQLLRVDHEEFTYNERHHVSERARANGRWIYSYDSFDQLIQASWKPIGNAPSKEWTAEYDGLGRRISKTWNGRTTEYYWDGDRLAAEVSPSEALRVYVYAAMDALSPCAFVDYPSVNAEPSEGKHYTVFHDALGLAVWIEDESGTPVWWPQSVESYGYVKPSTQSRMEYNLRWPGHYWDHELSLVYNRYRYYDSVLARYLQSDPLGTMGGINLYAYASNPLNDVDLLGLANKGCKKGQTPSSQPIPVTEQVADSNQAQSVTAPTWQRPKSLQLPQKGSWSGIPGNSDFIPDNPHKLGIAEGSVVPFHEGYPDFSQWSQATLNVQGLNGEHNNDMPRIYKAVAELQELPNPSASAGYAWLKAHNMTAHHAQGDVVQILPRKLHRGVRHSGSAASMRNDEDD